MGNNICILVNLSPSCDRIGYKCIFRKKIKVDGTIDKFKARLVAQGFNQRPDINGFDTYAPIARTTTIRLLIALIAIKGLAINKCKVNFSLL